MWCPSHYCVVYVYFGYLPQATTKQLTSRTTTKRIIILKFKIVEELLIALEQRCCNLSFLNSEWAVGRLPSEEHSARKTPLLLLQVGARFSKQKSTIKIFFLLRSCVMVTWPLKSEEFQNVRNQNNVLCCIN